MLNKRLIDDIPGILAKGYICSLEFVVLSQFQVMEITPVKLIHLAFN